jgi:hypothetical protein
MEDDGSLGRQLKMQQDQKTVFRKLLMTSWAFKTVPKPYQESDGGVYESP